MRIASIRFWVNDNFEPGDCVGCPLGLCESESGDIVCAMSYRFCDCPIKLDYNGYIMDEEDITD